MCKVHDGTIREVLRDILQILFLHPTDNLGLLTACFFDGSVAVPGDAPGRVVDGFRAGGG